MLIPEYEFPDMQILFALKPSDCFSHQMESLCLLIYHESFRLESELWTGCFTGRGQCEEQPVSRQTQQNVL